MPTGCVIVRPKGGIVLRGNWSRRQGFAAAAFAAVWAAILVFLVVSTALEAGKGPFAALVVVTIGVVGAVTTFLVAEGVPHNARHWTAWLQRRPMSSLFVALYAGFGAMTATLALLEPRAASESQPGALEKIGREILSEVESRPKPAPRVLQHIAGLWGEEECAVTFRFSVRGDALIVDAERRPAASRPYHLVATITSARGDVLEVRGEEPVEARGAAATFTYSSNGAVDTLNWDDQVSPHSSELRRCGGKSG
jgi:hypothetical protein